MIRRSSTPQSYRRWMALALAIACLFSSLLLPQGMARAGDERYGRTKADNVNVRPKPGTSDYSVRLPKDWVVEVVGETTHDNTTWYQVVTTAPNTGTREYTGYIHGNYLNILTEAEKTEWLNNPVQPGETTGGSGSGTTATTPIPNPGNLGTISRNGVNFRQTEGGKSLFQLDQGEVVELVTIPKFLISTEWFQVKYGDQAGYIQGPYITIMTKEQADEWWKNNPAGTGTSSKPTTVTPPPNSENAIGYVKVTKANSNLRDAAGGETIDQLAKDTILPYFVKPTSKSGYLWYFVKTAGGTVGYLRSDVVTVVDVSGNPIGSATNGPTAAPTALPTTIVGYVKVTKQNSNVRDTAAGETIGQVKKDVILPYYAQPVAKSGYTWYFVQPEGQRAGYLRSDVVAVVDANGNPITSTPTATPEGNATATAAPSATPTAVPGGTVVGYIKVIKQNSNIRDTAAGETIAQAKKGTLLAYYAQPVAKSGYLWYYVKPEGMPSGYLRSDVVELVDAAGNPTSAAPTATPSAGPTATADPGAIHGYVRITKDKVNLRDAAAGETIAQIKKDLVLPYLATPVQKSGYTWYYVETPSQGRGYVRSDCAVPTTSEGGSTPTPDPTTGPTAAPSTYGYVKLVMDKVNLRKSPNGASFAQLAKGIILPLTANPTTSGAYSWYPVKTTANQSGYIRGDMVSVCDENGNPVTTPTTAPTAPPAGTVVGYIQVTMKSVNLRDSAGGSTIAQLDKSTIWPMVGNAITKDRYTWYPIEAKGLKGYVRGDVAYQLTQEQVDAYLKGDPLPTPGPTPTPDPNTIASAYVVTILDDVNLRVSASKSAKAPHNVSIGTVMPFTGTTISAGSTWYKVTYANTTLYVMGSCVKVMTEAEYQAWLGTQPTPTPSPSPTPVPSEEDLSDMAETNVDNVLVRATASASGKSVAKIYKKNTIVTLTGNKTTEGSYTWRSVKLQSGQTGWIRNDVLRIYTKDEKKEYEEAQNPGGEGKPEASYETYRIGDTGEGVKKIQAELKAQGYYSGTLNGIYGTDTVKAIEDFQRAKSLTVDGVAGPNTQHALFGTVPIGTGDGTLTMHVYPVEKIDWYTGGISTLWAKGQTVKVQDVRTGIVFQLRRWAGGSHVDAEPLTAADTKRLCKIYGVSTAKEIADKNLWQRRPLWVTIGQKTYAASLYGVPHNYPDGDTIANNNYDGQLCVHFTNSKTHGGSSVDPFHTQAIQEAYDAYHKKK